MSTPADKGIAAAKHDAQAARDAEAQVWWSGRGRIACAEHVPTRGHEHPPACEACTALAKLARLDEGAS